MDMFFLLIICQWNIIYMVSPNFNIRCILGVAVGDDKIPLRLRGSSPLHPKQAVYFAVSFL